MQVHNIIKALITTLLVLPAAAALAAGNIELRTDVKKVQSMTGKDGRTVQREVPAGKVVPGDELLYTIFFRNTGKQSASSIVISDPVPEHTRYKDGSAFGAGTDITFSIDGGKSFAQPGQLIVKESNGKTRKAVATDYTNIRWVFRPQLAPGKQGSVQFRVILK